MRTVALSALLLSLALVLPARADGPGALDRLADEVAEAVARADAATAWLVTDEARLPGALVGTPPRLVLAADPLPEGTRAKVRLADGSEVEAIRVDGDADLGLAIYDLPGVTTPGLPPLREWPLRRGSLAVVGGPQPDLVVLPGTTALRADLSVATSAAGPLLVTTGGVLAGIRIVRGAPEIVRATYETAAYGAVVSLPHGGYVPMRLDPSTGRFVTEDVGVYSLAGNAVAPVEAADSARFVPGPAVARAVEEVEAEGRIRRPYLGVVTEDLGGHRVVTLRRRSLFVGGRIVERDGRPIDGDRLTIGEGGVRLTSVLPGSPAAEAGLKSGLTILSIDDEDVPSPAAFARALARRRPGDAVRLTVKGWAGVTEVTLGDLDEARGALPTVADLGLDCMPIGPDVARYLGLSPEAQGLVVRAVTADGAAAKSGLRKGDVLLRGGEGPIRDLPELEAVLAAAKGSVRLAVQRDGESIEVEVHLPARPARKAR